MIAIVILVILILVVVLVAVVARAKGILCFAGKISKPLIFFNCRDFRFF